MDTENRRYAVRKSLKFSVLDASAYATMLGLTQNYITPLALQLKATTAQIGLLSSMPNLSMALAQLAAPDLATRAGSRKGFILPVVFLHAILFIPILLVHYMFHDNPVWWLIGLVTVSSVLGSISNPAWGSMMADLVPTRLRGRYFGSRGRIAGVITLVFSYVAAIILQLFTGHNIFTGFAILFGGATVFRLLSMYFLSRMYEPSQVEIKEDSPGLLELIKNLGSSDLGKFTLYIALVDFCTMISAPFFSVFMLRDLHFSYITYSIVNSSTAITTLLFLTFWGRRADTAGNLKVIQITSMIIPLVPILWVFNNSVYYLLAANIVSGFAWSGYNLSAGNFVYDASEPGIRTKQIAVFNATDMIACCLGGVLGGYIAPHLPILFTFRLRTLFLMSGLLRATVVLLLLRQLKEVRRVPTMTIREMLRGRTGNNKRY